MALTKDKLIFVEEVVNTASSETVGQVIDLSEYYGCTILAKITNGGTAPSTQCSVYIEVLDSEDSGESYHNYIPNGRIAQSGNNKVSEFTFELPTSIKFARVVFRGNDTQDVTVEAVGYAYKV